MASGSLGASGAPGQVPSGPEITGKTALPYSPRRCEHDRKSPVLFPRWPGGSHWILIEAIARLHDNYRHRGTDRDRLHQTLKRAAGRRSKAKKIEPRKYAVTQKRSPREEAFTRTMTFALQHADVGHFDEDSHSLRVGVWNKEEERIERPYSLIEWARATGFKRPGQERTRPDGHKYRKQDRSSSRLDRALRTAGADCAGFLYRWQSKPLKNGRHTGKVAETFVALALFDALDLGDEIREAIEEERKKREIAAEQPQGPPQTPEARELVKQAMGTRGPDPLNPYEIADVDRPQFNSLCFAVAGENREWTGDQVAAEAARRLQRTKPPPDRR